MNIEYADWDDINSLAVAHKGLPAVFINNSLMSDPWNIILNETKKLFKDTSEISNIINQGGLIFFETLEEAQAFYNIFELSELYGEDLYASLYDATGKCLTENTLW